MKTAYGVIWKLKGPNGKVCKQAKWPIRPEHTVYPAFCSRWLQWSVNDEFDIISGLDISARPLAQASVKSVGRVQITDHSPVWRVRFFIAKKLIKLQSKRSFFYILFCREISKHKLTIAHICMAKFYTPNCPKNGRWSAALGCPLRENGIRFRKGLLAELELWRSFWNVDSRFDMLNFDAP